MLLSDKMADNGAAPVTVSRGLLPFRNHECGRCPGAYCSASGNVAGQEELNLLMLCSWRRMLSFACVFREIWGKIFEEEQKMQI